MIEWIVLGAFGFVFLGALLYFVAVYNGLVRLRNDIKKSLGNIDVLLKQRFDELPKLVNVCKGYMKYEQETFQKITEARSIYSNAKSVADKAKADTMVTGALKTLFAVAENYPQLKANENFKHLQERVSGIENEIADRREFYNDAVNNFNIRIQSFPDMFVASIMHLTPQEMFKASAEERKDVNISFE